MVGVTAKVRWIQCFPVVAEPVKVWQIGGLDGVAESVEVLGLEVSYGRAALAEVCLIAIFFKGSESRESRACLW